MSRAEVVLSFNREEFLQLLTTFGPFGLEGWILPGVTDPSAELLAADLDRRIAGDITVHYKWSPGVTATGTIPVLQGMVSTGGIHEFVVAPDARRIQPMQRALGDRVQSGPLLDRLWGTLLSRIGVLDAQRYNLGSSLFGTSGTLSATANNLPEVLNKLQSQPASWRRFNAAVREIVPSLHYVSVRPAANNILEVYLGPVGDELERDDLAMPLSECGTGVGQVLAILAAVHGTRTSGLMLLDEPQSFLHPTALRALLGHLRNTEGHQFVIATHSPLPLDVLRPESVHILTCIDNVASAESVDASTVQGAREMLQSVGARFSDVYGFEAVLWVEGRTEEECLRAILEAWGLLPRHGVGVIGVTDTGGFDKRMRARTLGIYRALTQSGGLLPSSLGFIFDRDRQSDEDAAAFEAAGGGLVRILPRRVFENYFLDPEAIAGVLMEDDPQSGAKHTPATVETWIKANGQARELFHGGPVPIPLSGEWTRVVDGARLLADLFSALSETRVEYRKVEHGLRLTLAILAREKEAFSELRELVQPLFDGASA